MWRAIIPSGIGVASFAIIYTAYALLGSAVTLSPVAIVETVTSMTKGLLTALAVMLVCTIIPVAQILLAPFGPFLGGYFGIRSVDVQGRTPLAAAILFGCVVGAVSAAILVVIAAVITFAAPLPVRLVILTWIAVAVFSGYVAGMSALGGLYRLMKMQPPATTPSPEAG